MVALNVSWISAWLHEGSDMGSMVEAHVYVEIFLIVLSSGAKTPQNKNSIQSEKKRVKNVIFNSYKTQQ